MLDQGRSCIDVFSGLGIVIAIIVLAVLAQSSRDHTVETLSRLGL